VQVVVMIVGALAEGVGWWAVASGDRSVWRVMPPVLVAMGLAAWIVRSPVPASGVGVGAAALVGALSGIALYAATRTFVAIVAGWAWFARSVEAIYGPTEQIGRGFAVALTIAMAATEELFWRGLFQARVSAGAGAAVGATLTWLAYVAANLPSTSAPIVAGALVGGAVWAGLAWWSGGLLASLLCHAIWTGAMVALPPRRRTSASR
jgi:CAAX protease family protein